MSRAGSFAVVLVVAVAGGFSVPVAADPMPAAAAPAAESSCAATPDAQWVERWLGWVRERRPAEYERLVRLRAEAPATFEAEVRRRFSDWPRGLPDRMTGASGGAAEQYAARIESLARVYREAAAEQRPAIRNEIRRLVTIAFDLREAERRDRLARIEKELQKLKRELEQRRAARDEMIERKVREILEGSAATP
ncbi:MAG: hypothetical protein N2652_00060 [Kiritimatiellae bacterium]|nr:hypothetical protein [Kiritimatiellia bacterium]